MCQAPAVTGARFESGLGGSHRLRSRCLAEGGPAPGSLPVGGAGGWWTGLGQPAWAPRTPGSFWLLNASFSAEISSFILLTPELEGETGRRGWRKDSGEIGTSSGKSPLLSFSHRTETWGAGGQCGPGVLEDRAQQHPVGCDCWATAGGEGASMEKLRGTWVGTRGSRQTAWDFWCFIFTSPKSSCQPQGT